MPCRPLRLTLASFNVFLAPHMQNTESTFLLSNILALPPMFTSSAMLPLQIMPDWPLTVARYNPVTCVINTMRLFLYGHNFDSLDSTTSLLVKTELIFGGPVVVTLFLAGRSLQQSVR